MYELAIMATVAALHQLEGVDVKCSRCHGHTH